MPGRPTATLRVITVIDGEFDATEIRFQAFSITSCDPYPARGVPGFVSGFPIEGQDNVLIFDSILRPSEIARRGGRYT